MKKQLKEYKAWAKVKGSLNNFITTVIYKKNIREAKKWFVENDYEIDGSIYKA